MASKWGAGDIWLFQYFQATSNSNELGLLTDPWLYGCIDPVFLDLDLHSNMLGASRQLMMSRARHCL